MIVHNYNQFEYNKDYYITFNSDIISDTSPSKNIFGGILDNSIFKLKIRKKIGDQHRYKVEKSYENPIGNIKSFNRSRKF